MSNRLKLSDVRKLFRLLAEVRRRGDRPSDWRPYMASELLKFFQAEFVISTEIYLQPAPGNGQWTVTDIGWGTDSSGNTWRIESKNDEADPQAYNLIIRPNAQPAEDHLAIDPARQFYGGTAFIMSSVPLRHISAVDQIGIHRTHGTPHFTHSDHRLLRILHLELARFWRTDVLDRTRDPQQDLAPRLKQTLALLVEGKSEKEIAHAIGISPHTVHNYVKALHQRFNVCSRGELLAAAAAQRGNDFVPKLSVEVFPAAKKKSRKSKATKSASAT